MRELFVGIIPMGRAFDAEENAAATVFLASDEARSINGDTIAIDGGSLTRGYPTLLTGLRLRSEKIIICVGGVSRRLPIPGFELTSTHSAALALTEVPPSMLFIGGGATGVQVASIFNAFGSRVELFERGPRILAAEDEDVAAAVASAFHDAGIVVHENFGAIDSFKKTSAGVRTTFSKDGKRDSAEAALAVMAAGWVANSSALDLAAAGVLADNRGFVNVENLLVFRRPADAIWTLRDQGPLRS